VTTEKYKGFLTTSGNFLKMNINGLMLIHVVIHDTQAFWILKKE
jgi:hypothetical protein